MVAMPREVHLTCSMCIGQEVCGQYLFDVYIHIVICLHICECECILHVACFGVVLSELHFEGTERICMEREVVRLRSEAPTVELWSRICI